MTIIRRDPGLFYEDFTVGDIYEHGLGRTIKTTRHYVDGVYSTSARNSSPASG